MTYRIRITLLISLCACSIQDPELASSSPSSEPGASEPASPDAESLPAAVRLIPEPVDSVEDLPGRYAQPFALPGQISVITIGLPNYAAGNYELYRSCGVPACLQETGRYHVVPTNPATGFAAISLVDQSGTVRTTYLLDFLWRDGEGRLVAVQLRALVGNATGPTQVWWRMPEDETEPPIEPAMTPPTGDESPALRRAPADEDVDVATLGGVFVRPLPIYGDIGAITLGDAAWIETTATGTYDASYPYCLPWCVPETGDYELDLANATTGTGHLSLVPAADATAAHDYAVYAIWRALDGTAMAIQLQRLDGVVPSGSPFVMYRQWWTTSAAAAPSEVASCTVWRGLALYYQTRALQCGMGACWPLSPWYSAWARYYQGLADAAGCADTE